MRGPGTLSVQTSGSGLENSPALAQRLISSYLLATGRSKDVGVELPRKPATTRSVGARIKKVSRLRVKLAFSVRFYFLSLVSSSSAPYFLMVVALSTEITKVVPAISMLVRCSGTQKKRLLQRMITPELDSLCVKPLYRPSRVVAGLQ